MTTSIKWMNALCLFVLIALAQTAYAADSSAARAIEGSTPETTQLSVIGAGSLGSAVGAAWVESGYKVMLSSRHPDELAPMAKRLGPNARVGTPKQAAQYGQVVLLAVPFTAIPQIAHDFDDALQGKIVLDATNSWGVEDSPIGQQAVKAGDGVVSQRYFKGVRLVRAFSAVDASIIRGVTAGRHEPAGIPIASNDKAAMQVAAELVRAAGCVPVIVGDLKDGRRFEHGQPGFRANTTAPELRRILDLPAQD
ncbi:NADPH-dependent F420 reductase [Salinisphaera sp. SPP-AMP-43]|uniref:NADPH-dependent F420 reductase n=1 Tax=Salinisphaera sp. SPP-AMP-43 TaxID=3121288 RepID=UPI003C6E41AA